MTMDIPGCASIGHTVKATDRLSHPWPHRRMSRANARRGGVSLSSLSSDLSSADTLVAEDQDYNYDKTQLPTFIAPFQFDTALPRHMTALQRLSPPLIVKCLKTATTVSHPRDILTATLSIASIDGVPSTDGGCTPDIIEPSTFIRGPNMTREVFTLHDDPWLRFVFYWFEGAGGRGGGSDENSISLSTTLGMKRVVLRARFYVYRVVVEEDGEVDEEQDPKWRDREYLGECLSEEVDVCPEGWTGGPVMGYEEVDLLGEYQSLYSTRKQTLT